MNYSYKKKSIYGGNMKNFIIKYKYEISSILFICVASLMLLSIFWNLNNMTLNIPISYYGGDDFHTLKSAKSIMDTGWVLENEYLGAPFGATYYGYPSLATSNFDYLLIKFLAFLTNDAVASVNLEYILLFPIISLISYYVMRKLKISNLISVFASLTYAFLPYIFLRGMSHTVLSAYQFVPLSIMLCIWIYEDDNFFNLNRGFYKYKQNYIGIFCALLIANNGIAYYPFFTCFFICVTGFIKAINSKKMKDFFRSITLVFNILIFFLISLIPVILYKFTNNFFMESTNRVRTDAEIYGLKIFQLFLPVNSHGINILQRLINYYNSNAPLVNENSYSYLGIAGVFGFIALLCALFIRNSKNNQRFENIKLLSELNIAAVLLATIGGFGSLIAVLITPMIRAYNRISIFIAYISILALALILNDIRNKAGKYKSVYYSMIIIFFSLSIIESFPGNVPNYEYVSATYNSDKKFVKAIEATVSENAMIFQLPYHAFPESGPVNNMNDYHLLAPYFNSNTLKWSYGGVKGGKGDLWNSYISSLDIETMVKSISLAGFEGIYIDKRAYGEEDYNNLENKLISIIQVEPIYSDNNLLSFINMKKFNEKNTALYTDEELEDVQYQILNLNNISLGTGFTSIEGERPNQWMWLSNQSELIITNFSETEKQFNLTFDICSSSIEKSTLIITVNEKDNSYLIDSNGISINQKVILNPGNNIIKFYTDAPRVNAPEDPRLLYLKIYNFDKMYEKPSLK